MTTTLEELREEWGFASSFTLDDAIDQWRRLVAELERGYEGTIYDFESEVEFREDLELVIAELPPADRHQLAAELARLDSRFLASTRASDLPLLAAPGGARLALWAREPSKIKSVDPDVKVTWRA
jgi:hypothetical protein